MIVYAVCEVEWGRDEVVRRGEKGFECRFKEWMFFRVVELRTEGRVRVLGRWFFVVFFWRECFDFMIFFGFVFVNYLLGVGEEVEFIYRSLFL